MKIWRNDLMKQQNVFGKPNDHSTPPERQARIHRHGSLIFLGQILVLGSVPIFDLGQDRTPTLFVMFSLSVSIATVWSLGYQRLTHLLASLSLIACLWIFIAQVEVNLGMRTVPLLIFLFVKLFCAYLCIRQAFKVGVASAQRIYCGAASFVMIGIIFAGIDVIGDYLTEINVTSPTCIREIADFGGPDVAKLIWDAIEARLKR